MKNYSGIYQSPVLENILTTELQENFRGLFSSPEGWKEIYWENGQVQTRLLGLDSQNTALRVSEVITPTIELSPMYMRYYILLNKENNNFIIDANNINISRSWEFIFIYDNIDFDNVNIKPVIKLSKNNEETIDLLKDTFVNDGSIYRLNSIKSEEKINFVFNILSQDFNNYYNKNEIDETFVSNVELVNNYYNKSEIDNKENQIPEKCFILKNIPNYQLTYGGNMKKCTIYIDDEVSTDEQYATLQIVYPEVEFENDCLDLELKWISAHPISQSYMLNLIVQFSSPVSIDGGGTFVSLWTTKLPPFGTARLLIKGRTVFTEAVTDINGVIINERIRNILKYEVE
jgi:hypothetical protein